MRLPLTNFVSVGPCCVISTKAEGRAERVPKRETTRLGSQISGREGALRQIRGQMSRLRFAPLDMTGRDVPPKTDYEKLSRTR